MDIAAFIEARLGEDKLLALASCTGGSDREWTAEPVGMSVGRVLDSRGETVACGEGSPAHARAMHIARHDPARVLREVAAKRAILARYRHASRYDRPGTSSYKDGYSDGEVEALAMAVHNLAAVWSDHPDYDQEPQERKP